MKKLDNKMLKEEREQQNDSDVIDITCDCCNDTETRKEEG